MIKEEIIKHTLGGLEKYQSDFDEVTEYITSCIDLAYEEGKSSRIENNTLTIEIPKGYKTLDTRELSEGERLWIEVDLIEESKMCKIRQPHDGIDCPCNIKEK